MFSACSMMKAEFHDRLPDRPKPECFAHPLRDTRQLGKDHKNGQRDGLALRAVHRF